MTEWVVLHPWLTLASGMAVMFVALMLKGWRKADRLLETVTNPQES